MRFRANRIPVYILASASLTALMIGALGVGGALASSPQGTAIARPNGPAADYPVLLGDPFVIDGVTYTPQDTMNYDHVGYLVADGDDTPRITGSHRTLPIPSYVEVTSLETGRTILVRLERRGPMTSGGLIGLSAGALTQLGAAGGAPIRVRRVNPPEAERALLRSGQEAPARMDTPMSLVNVLKRRLPDNPSTSASLAAPKQGAPATDAPESLMPETPVPLAMSGHAVPSPIPETDPDAPLEMGQASLPPLDDDTAVETASEAVVAPAAEPAQAEPEVAAPTPTAALSGGFVVQAGAFSTRNRAERVAGIIGGFVTEAGALFRVRTGPFANRAEAEASLAKVRDAGYREARILNRE